MRRLVLISTFIFVFVNSNAQRNIDKTDSLRLSIVNELNQKQIKDFFFLIQISPTSPIVIESEKTNFQQTVTNFIGYAFWTENSKSYIQKFDYRGKFKIEEIIGFKGFELISKNINKIKTESVLPYVIRERNEFQTLITPNQYQYCFNFNIGSIKFEKQFQVDGLIKNDYFDRSEMQNINYSKNINLETIKLFNLCQVEVKKLESKKLVRY
jgi:hypothetical protein